MRIVITGGGGAMAEVAARTIADFDAVSQVVLADLDGDRVVAAAQRIGPKALPVRANVLDTDAMARVMGGTRAVLNCAGPFYKLGRPVLEGAIAAGCDYLDICDDPEPTLDMLTLDEAARQRGITAVVGMGASPGVTNMLAAVAVSELETCNDLVTGWNLEDGTDETDLAPEGQDPSAALVHWVEQLTGQIPAWEEGKLSQVMPMTPVRVHYPSIGGRTLYSVGHPEPVTLPRTYPAVQHSCNVMVLPAEVIGLLKRVTGLVNTGEISTEEAARRIGHEMGKTPTLTERLFVWAQRLFDGPRFPALFAVAEGIRSDRSCRVAAHIASLPGGGMAGVTGIPLAVGLQMLLEDGFSKPGVHAPEAVFSPSAFFERLRPYCNQPFLAEDLDLVVVRSQV